MTITNTKIIYDQLKEIGLTRAQVRKLLPDWWSPEAEKYPDGIAEFCVLISRRLSLDLVSLMNGVLGINRSASVVAYKHRADATLQSLQASTCIATSLAQAVIAAMPQPYIPMSPSPTDFAALSKKNGNGLVSLSSLIDSCWSIGIPIIPIPNLPVGIRKMDGAVIKVGSRPAIIMSKKKSSRAWLSFILAHEIGHIGCGHLGDEGSIIDVSLQEQATYESESSADLQEREADAFALSLLGGTAVDGAISGWPTWCSPVDIAVRAKESAPSLGVESGHLVLRYAFKTKRWPDAMSALAFLSEDSGAELVMKSALKQNLNLDLVAEDLKDLVCQVTAIDCN
jgi:hypothetical protein